jgi:hypothetical protein
MNITVRRQACCSQDDQMGPLEMKYTIEANSTFASLVHEIIKSGFLQFSSSHDRITGEADDKELVEVFSPYSMNTRQPEFKINPNMPVVDVLGDKSLAFSFRHV